MKPLSPDVFDAAQALWLQIRMFAKGMLLPWRLNQLLAIAALFLIAHFAAKPIGHWLTTWLRKRQGWTKWKLRLGILIQQRVRVILFALLAWILVAVMRELTWPSRSQLIALAASIATAWAAIGFVTRIIRTRLLRRLVRWFAWIFATLYFLDFLTVAENLLDSLALSFGEFRLSALTVIKAVVVTVVMIVAARLFSRFVTRKLAKNSDIAPEVQILISKVLQGVLITLAILIGVKAAGFDLTGFTVFTGALGVGLGFGLQKVISNLMSGFIILMDKSIKPGDVISIGDTFGWIEELGARYTSVVTRDGREYLVPNEDLVTGQVVNWSHTNDFVRLDLFFGASYRDDPHEVTKIAINASLSVKRVLAQRTPVCWITGFGERSVEYILRFWISDPTAGITNVKGQVYMAIWDAFKKNGVELPYPQMEVRMLRANRDEENAPHFQMTTSLKD
ncbi:mechanosensitive ion channel family protein [Paracoccus aminophilus]|uniref:MscS mechanosensitive ion channel n=1 Tax=Paracoccus aminophilus JCM 7686 TaxID=1367847 RepID=S5Y817_PARAH|nr:mechanosensitive ion channel domain-containing protein [Paracoccus aminophilus]AGT07483.1 MscS mechanosensitive ion channel [Paracoccus aminophilus JCM 7686]